MIFVLQQNIRSMKSGFCISTGISLIVGSMLAIVTMALHPSGGSIEHIISISRLLIFSHSLAISCLPFMLFGFYGLTTKLRGEYQLSVLAFIVIAFGLFAAMIAALINGLALPYFLSHYVENIEQNTKVIKPIIAYSFAINKALDYVFIVACCVAISIYSLKVISSRKLPKWIGYYGMTILLIAIVGACTNFVFTSLMGFRIFVFGIAGWILSSGVLLMISKNNNDIQRENKEGVQ